MKTVGLEREPCYTALSYTWGLPRSLWKTGAHQAFNAWLHHDNLAFDMTKLTAPQTETSQRATVKATCNGKHIMILPNLFQGMKQLRNKRHEEWF